MYVIRFFKTYRSQTIFILLLVLLFFAYRYPYLLEKGPYSMHSWRQGDCLSIAMNYYQEGLKFFEPSIHWIGSNDTGKTVSEFPALYYLVAILWKIFGYNTAIFRLVNILIVFTGLFYLFRFIKEFLSDNFWAVYIPLFLFTSPILVFYTNNFLMNAPAFGFVLIAAYHYWKYKQQKRTKYLYSAMVFFMIAGLLKITALLLFIALLIMHALSLIPYFRKRFTIEGNREYYHLIPYVIVILVTFLWVSWAKDYNKRNVSGVFLQQVYPIWDIDLSEAIKIGTEFYSRLVPGYFNIVGHFLVLFLFLLLAIKAKKANRYLVWLNIIVLSGMLLYSLMFYKALSNHDYYIINLLIFIPLCLVTFLDYLKKNFLSVYRSRSFRGLAIVGLVMLVYYATVQQRVKYDTSDTFVKHTIILDRSYVNMWRNYHRNYTNRLKALESITPYLRELGIKRDDRVISIPDGTVNVSLVMMDQKGFTDFGYGTIKGEQRMKRLIERGAKYLIVNDPGILNQDYLKPYLREPIGNYQNVTIFRLPSVPGQASPGS